MSEAESFENGIIGKHEFERFFLPSPQLEQTNLLFEIDDAIKFPPPPTVTNHSYRF